LGPVMMGPIISWTSYPTMFLCLALVGVMNLVYFYLFVRKGRQGGSTPPPGDGGGVLPEG